MLDPVNCRNCRRKFIPRRYWQVFCSKECREKFHNYIGPDNCPECGAKLR